MNVSSFQRVLDQIGTMLGNHAIVIERSASYAGPTRWTITLEGKTTAKAAPLVPLPQEPKDSAVVNE